MNAIEDSLSDLASFKHEEDGEDKDDDVEDTWLGKLSKDDEPGWVMGTIPNTVQHCIESCWQKLMRLHKLTQPEWGRRRLPPSERYQVQDDTIEGSGSWEAPNRHDCSHTISNSIWRRYAGS